MKIFKANNIWMPFALCFALLALKSCTSADIQPQPGSEAEKYTSFIEASIDESDATKAYLSGDDTQGYDVLWAKEDRLIVNLKSGITFRRAIFELVDGDGTTKATFGCKDAIDWSAFNRIEAYCDYDPDSGEWPSLQPYNEDGLMGLSPMKASADIYGVSPALKFKNEGGAFKIKATGCCLLKSVTVQADNLPLIRLDSPTPGIRLRQEITPLWFSLPAGTYHGFKVTFTDMEENVIVKTLKKDLTIERSRVTLASISGIPSAPLKMKAAASRMDALQVDWTTGRIAEGHPYSIKRIFHRDDTLRLVDMRPSSPEQEIEFVTDEDSRAEGMYMTSMFYGLGATKGVDYAVTYPSEATLRANGGALIGVSVPQVQQLKAAMSEPSAQLWAGSVTLADEVQLCVMDNMVAWVKVGLTEYVSRVVFRSNSDSDVLSSSNGLQLLREDGKWHIVKTGEGTYSNFVSAQKDNPGYGDAWLSVLPCLMAEGFMLEFYSSKDDAYPLYVKRFDGSLSLGQGDILDCGKVYRDTNSSLLAMYNDPADGYFFEVCGRRQQVQEYLPLKELAQLGDVPQGLFYPLAGRPFDVYFYADLDGGANSLNVNGHEAEATGKTVTVSGLEFKEYVAHNVSIAKTEPTKPMTLAVVNNGEAVAVIPFPYTVYSDVPQQQFEYGSSYVLATDGYSSFITTSDEDYDYRLSDTGTRMGLEAIWLAEDPGGSVPTRARLYAQRDGKRFYLQHQHYRPIVYSSANQQGIDLWGVWSIYDTCLVHETQGEGYKKFYPKAEQDGVLGASDTAPATSFHVYKIEVIR